MTIDVAEALAPYSLDHAVQQLEDRMSHYGSLFRCVTCRTSWSEDANQSVVVFDPHLGHSCGESGPILVGLSHEKCEANSAYPYNQKDLPRFIHHQHGFFGRRSQGVPTCVVVSTLLFDVLWVQPDGTTEEPWLSASLANGSTRIDSASQLEGQVPSAANGWIGVGDTSAIVTIGGQTVFDFELHEPMAQWLTDAETEGAMLFIQSPLQPRAAAESASEAIMEPVALDRAIGEIVGREPMAAVSLPVRTSTSQGKGAGRNETCPCLSGTKFKRCCG